MLRGKNFGFLRRQGRREGKEGGGGRLELRQPCSTDPSPVFGSGVLFHLWRARQSAFERLRRGYESLPTSEKSNFPFLFPATNVFITGHA